MFPYLTVLGRTVPVYALCGVAGVLLGWLYTVLRGARLGLDRDDCCFLYLYGVIGMLAGAQLLYALVNLPAMAADMALLLRDPVRFLRAYVFGGLVFYGGLCGALAGAALYARRYRLRLAGFLPAAVPAVPLAHAFGRVGCFMAGCCYGVPAPPPWGLYFDASPVAPHGTALLPVQLYEAAGDLAIFAVLTRYAARTGRPVRVLALYLILYAVLRFALERLRYDAYRGIIGPLSVSGWISVGLAAAGLALWRQAKAAAPAQ